MHEISASSWFYYKEIYYDARAHERKKNTQPSLRFIVLLKGKFIALFILIFTF